MRVIIIGNGAVGLMTAREILARIPEAHVTVVAPDTRPGCASTAAAAMFNSFAEVDVTTFRNRFERDKWLFNHAAAPLWRRVLTELAAESGVNIHHGFGTYVINNHVSDTLEDDNFDAVVSALREFCEPHSILDPRDIPHYKPASPSRAARSVFIPNEGWVNPLHLLAALTESLQRSGRMDLVDGSCASLAAANSARIGRVCLTDGRTIEGDVFVLSPGANFSAIVNASGLGLQFPRVFYGVGCTVLLKTKENTLSNCIRTPNRGLACGVYSAPRDADHTIIGASNLISPAPLTHAQAGSVYNLLKAAMEQINRDYYRAEVIAVNIGWRPTSADTLPMIGRTALENLLVATATKRDGLHCSPLIARCLVDVVTTGRSSHDISLFKPDRTPTKTVSRAEAVETYVRHSMNANYQHDFVPAKNRMIDDLQRMYRVDIEALHDELGAHDWGIPSEMVNMYRYKHILRH